jgi:hypothetical protein
MAGQKKNNKKEYFVVFEEDRTGIARDLPLVCGVCDLLLHMLSFFFIVIPRITKTQITTMTVKKLSLSFIGFSPSPIE